MTPDERQALADALARLAKAERRAAEAERKVRAVEGLLRLAGGEGSSGGVIAGHALRRALDGEP